MLWGRMLRFIIFLNDFCREWCAWMGVASYLDIHFRLGWKLLGGRVGHSILDHFQLYFRFSAFNNYSWTTSFFLCRKSIFFMWSETPGRWILCNIFKPSWILNFNFLQISYEIKMVSKKKKRKKWFTFLTEKNAKYSGYKLVDF